MGKSKGPESVALRFGLVMALALIYNQLRSSYILQRSNLRTQLS